jgi:hypothetical protein
MANPKIPKGRSINKSGAKNAARTVLRWKLAAAVVTGQPIAEIARQAGVSRSWASREAHSPETRLLIDGILDKHAAEVKELIELGLIAIRDCLGPVHTIKMPGKKTRIEPNDPRVRLLALKRVIELSAAGRSKHEEVAGGGTITWQQFLTLYEAHQAETRMTED